MFPGLSTKLSEEKIAATTSITVRRDLVRVTDTTATTTIATILGQFGGGFGGIIFLANDSGAAINITSTGNVQLAATITVPNKFLLPLAFSKDLGKWYAGAIS